jgi:hypothetical protein
MTDKQIVKLIESLIKEKGITLQDMIGDEYIDPEQKIDDSYGNPETSRWNIFKADSWSDRLVELICEEAYNPYADYHRLKIPLQDLIRFWWNNCISREEMLEDIFEDIFCYFKDKMLPKEEKVKIDLSIKTDELILPENKLKVSNLF